MARAERGRANDAVAALVAVSLGVARDDVRLVTGATSRDKIFEIDGLTAREVDGALARAAGEGR